MKRAARTLAVFTVLSAARLSAQAPANSPASATVTATPAPHHGAPSRSTFKDDKGVFLGKHQKILERGKQGPIELLFLGDSITEKWAKAPDVWTAHYGKYQPANFGVGGDRTQHLLWRIDNGELDGLHPKVVVLLIGTNNSADDTAPEIIDAEKLIVKKVQEKLPESKILLLGIFPRGPRKAANGTWDDGLKRKETIGTVNAALAKLDDGKNIRFLDIGKIFLGPDGKIPDDLMPDQLHPSPKGYELWANAMQPLLDEMMK